MEGPESSKEDRQFTFMHLLLQWVGFKEQKEKQNFSEKKANCKNVKLVGDVWN